MPSLRWAAQLQPLQRLTAGLRPPVPPGAAAVDEQEQRVPAGSKL